LVSRAQDAMRRMRRDVHSQWAVPALYLATPTATPRPCNVRRWLKSDNNMLGALKGLPGAAEMAEPEDRLVFDVTEFSFVRAKAVVSIEAGEAYRIEFAYPAAKGFQIVRVTRLSATEADGLAVPTP
jgi:hypothetical protein